ncbi:hypothetical protein [Pedobacter sp. MR22-3]|uniref:hypothetical protein n=1 Tax=Pedobacter sp. MR22-3 TaxID=2994552 RepID=UPI002245AC55|nr:hypothetical protein [Pedobacter sp. MR22-3]MCX2584285.1 hypothetical protein [Pedobacter sp. MR22-3]
MDTNISILDAEQPLDASCVQSFLSYAGFSEQHLDLGNSKYIDFYKAADLLSYSPDWEGNRNEYLTKKLGYDGLMVKERAWDEWDYYPEDIGIDWEKSEDPLIWPPKTIAIYNQNKVSGFELYKDGQVYGNEPELSSYSI